MALEGKITPESVASAMDQGVSPDDVKKVMKTPDQLRIVDDVAASREGFDLPAMVDESEGFSLAQASPDYTPMPMPESAVSQSAAFASVIAEGDPLTNYRKIKQDLLETGNSETLAAVEQIISTEEDESLRKAFEDLLVNTPGLSPDKVKEYVGIYDQMKGEIPGKARDFRTAAAERMAATVDPLKPKKEQQVQINIWENIDKQLAADEIIRQKIEESISRSDTSEVGLEFLESAAVPFAESAIINQVHQEVFGKESSWYDYILVGEKTHELKAALHKLPPERRIEYAEAVISALEANSGFIRDKNDYHKYEELLKLLTDYDPEGTDWDRVIDNMVGILDAVSFGIAGSLLFKNAVRVGKAIVPGSPADVLRNSNPAAARELSVGAMDDLELQGALGASREDLINDLVVPIPDGTEIRVGPDLVDSLEPSSLLFTERDRIAKEQGIWNELNALKDAYLHTNKSSVIANEAEDGFVVKARYGLSEDYGFATVEDALDKAEALGVNLDEVKLFQRDYTTNTFKEMSDEDVALAKAFPEKSMGEYLFEAKHEYKLMPEDKLIFGSGSVLVKGAKAKYLSSPAARFDESIVRSAHRAFDNAKFVEKQLLDIVREPFFKLGNESKIKVLAAIEDGARLKKKFTYNELVANYPDMTIREIEGYNAVTKFWDTMWFLNNKRLKDDMTRRGVQQIVNASADFRHAAHPLEARNARNVEWAYDPVGKVVQKLTPEMVDRLYQRGGSIGSLESSVRTPGHITNRVIIDPMFGTEVKALPENVLNYIPGYYTRIYEDAYFIEKTHTNVLVNGKRADKNNPHARTIMVASNRAEAEKIIARLSEANDDASVGYRWKHDRAITDQTERSQADADIMSLQGRLFFSKRGDQLEAMDGLARTADPIESIQRAATAVANRIGTDEWLKTMKTTFLRTYGDLIHSPKDQFGQPTFPGRRAEIRNDRQITDPRVKEAHAMWDYISLMGGAEDVSAAHWRSVMVNLAEWITGDGSSYARTLVGDTVMKAKDLNPLAKLRQVPFTLFLAANPVRQAFLQSQQFNFLVGIDPKAAFGTAFKDTPAMIFGMAAIDRPDVWAKVAPAAAKAMGMSVNEYKAFVNAFRKSGMPYSVDSHMFVQGMAFHPSFEVAKTAKAKALKYAGNTVKVPLNILKSVGFDFGEFTNLASTWSFARRQWIKNNPGKKWDSKKALDEISALARDWSLAMTKSGSMGYQRGYGSLITQFVAVQHKAFEAMLPAKFGGSRAFTADQKRRMMIGNLMLYGTAGLGISSFYTWARDEFGLDVSGEVGKLIDMMMQGGLFEIAVNKTMDALFQQEGQPDSKIAISQDFAPVSGFYHTVVDMFGEALMGDASLIEAFAGPSGAAMGRIGDAVGLAGHILKGTEIDTLDKALWSLSALGTATSGWNNYIQAKMMMKHGHVISNQGDYIAQSTFAEAVARGVFGFKTYDEAEYWLTRRSLSEIKKDLDATADEYYERTMAVAMRYREHGDYTHLEEGLRTEGIMLGSLDDWEKAYVIERFRQRLLRDKQDGVQGLADAFGDAVLKGMIDPESHWRATIQNHSTLTDEQKEAAIKIIDYFSEKAEAIKGDYE